MEKEYVVTLKNAEDADQFYSEMTASSGDGVVPNRTVDVVNARPGSLRNTEYSLTEEEAAALKEDDRVLDVEIPVHLMENVSSGPALTQTGDFDKTTSSTGDNINWGLIRSNNTANNYGLGSATSENYNYFLDGTGVDIVVKDSGIEANHPEWEDANGTSRLQQINWYTEAGVSGTQSSSFYTDNSGHGTHVAGIAAGKNYGWAKGARIYAMKIEGTGAIAESGVTYSAYDLIRLWHNNKPVDPATGYKRPTIVNSSWGWYNTFTVVPTNYGLNYRGVSYLGASIDTAAERLAKGWRGDQTNYEQPFRNTAIDAEVEDMINAGVIFVHAAGNYGFKIDLPGGPDYNNYSYNLNNNNGRYNQGMSPTGASNRNNGFGDSIEVGAIDRAAYSSSLDQRTVYSNTGPGVDIYAPGENIMSAWRTATGGQYGSGSTYFWNSSYRQKNIGGTSMACPQVAGLAALVAQLNPHFTSAQMKDYIKTKCSTTGYIYDAGGNNNFSDGRALYGGGDLFLKNPFNSQYSYQVG